MTTRTEQPYIVHIDIPSTAVSRTDAILAAMKTVQLSGLKSYACSAEEVDAADRPAPTARPEHKGDTRFQGEFLG